MTLSAATSVADIRHGRPVTIDRRQSDRWLLLFMIANVGIALAAFHVQTLATAHALLTLGVGLWLAARKRLFETACVGAYIAGAEVLWRMTEADVFWEFGKYAMIALFLAALLRSGRLRTPFLALVYFVLLVPSIWLTATMEEWGWARDQISFNLSGPLALFVAAWFFTKLRITSGRLRTIFVAILAPIVGVASIAIFNTVSADHIAFANESNVVTSGGFGPNQVSSVLGLGIVVVTLMLFYFRWKRSAQIVLGFVLMTLVVQCSLTFSRTGLALAFITLLAAGWFIVRTRRGRVQLAIGGALAFAFVQFLMVPALNDYTGGLYEQRFTDGSSTGRVDIARVDFMVWRDHPVLGVGPGRALTYRAQWGNPAGAHTEFTRMLAEHGILGIGAMISMFLMIWSNLRRAHGPTTKALVIAFLAWSTVYMLATAFRLAAPAILMGIPFAVIALDERIRWRPKDVCLPAFVRRNA